MLMFVEQSFLYPYSYIVVNYENVIILLLIKVMSLEQCCIIDLHLYIEIVELW